MVCAGPGQPGGGMVLLEERFQVLERRKGGKENPVWLDLRALSTGSSVHEDGVHGAFLQARICAP